MRFGWMVEIDPHDPGSVPRKRTALGRFQHEGANTIVGKTGHVAAYMGDDEKFEYIYKFVTRERFDAKNPVANRDLLDHGTLYVARFDADGTGEWLPLVHDEKGPLNSRAGFANQGDVVIKVRAAADLLGATPMDRPEDVEPSPRSPGASTLPAPSPRTAASPSDDGQWSGRDLDIGVNAANPRPDNRSGHIIEITENGDDATATRFKWDVFLLAGDPGRGPLHRRCQRARGGQTRRAGHLFRRVRESHRPHAKCIVPTISASIRRAACGSSPTRTIATGLTMAASSCRPAGPERGLLQQLASGPVGCEVCGCEFTPDGRTLFLSIQHPGEGGTLDNPRSHWPDGNGLPARASLLAIEREDGSPV